MNKELIWSNFLQNIEKSAETQMTSKLLTGIADKFRRAFDAAVESVYCDDNDPNIPTLTERVYIQE